jgi:spoIIIJ-associated protein
MTTDRRFFSGDSLAQALNQAAQHFKLMPSEIEYKVIEKRHGFLKVRRKVMIEVSESAPRKATAPQPREQPQEQPRGRVDYRAEALPVEEAPEAESAPIDPMPADEEATPAAAEPWEAKGESEPVETAETSPFETAVESAPAEEPREEKTEEAADHVELAEAPAPASKRFAPAEGEEAQAAAEALQKILALASLDLESEILQGDGQLEIELWGAGQKILLRDRGRLLLAIQHLLPRAVRGLIGRSVPCRVDSDNFHEIREERLRDLAQRAADDVRHRGRTKTLEPMSPDERRIVHLTLSDYPGVETESQGSGLFKRVMVRKVRHGERPRGFDPYNR